MYQKTTDTLRILLLTGIFLMMGLFVFAFYQEQEKSIFTLQQQYAQNIQKQLKNLLEPLVGPDNLTTSAQVKLQQMDKTIVSKNLHTTTTTRYQGPSLKSQHVSIAFNKTKNITESDIFFNRNCIFSKILEYNSEYFIEFFRLVTSYIFTIKQNNALCGVIKTS
jgi:hypothetical protein